jgi:1,3-beta-glucan synthase
MASCKNMFEQLMVQLESRSSRYGMDKALESLYSDYIAGPNSNYKQWLISSKIVFCDNDGIPLEFKSDNTVARREQKFGELTSDSSPNKKVTQIALYLLCWGEANQVRFMPECLALIFKVHYEYYLAMNNKGLTRGGELNLERQYHYLDHFINPLYNFLKDQLYETEETGAIGSRREKDHKYTIGYDDMNQFFWYGKNLDKIKFSDGSSFSSLGPEETYKKFGDIKWERVFTKTFREGRSILHLIINFNRIWIIHMCVFWYYTAFNAPTLYLPSSIIDQDGTEPSFLVRSTIVALGGAFAPLINIIAMLSELRFTVSNFPGTPSVVMGPCIMLTLLSSIIGPSVYIFHFCTNETVGKIVVIVQLVFGMVVSAFLAVVPLSAFRHFRFGSRNLQSEKYLPNQVFTASFHSMDPGCRGVSIGLWIGVFFAKFIESYFFLTLSLRDPLRELSNMVFLNCTDIVYLGRTLCEYQGWILLITMLVIDLVLFFLDTYLWYIIVNVSFSAARAVYSGMSIWTPWKQIYSQLPSRIVCQILYSNDKPNDHYHTKISKIWNSIVLGMYREHILPEEQARLLLYSGTASESQDLSTDGRSPRPLGTAFIPDSHFTRAFEGNPEAERRISYFAQSLATTFPSAMAVEELPAFTVLVPHYQEKVLLSIKEAISVSEEMGASKVTQMEYLKGLHPNEWESFKTERMNVQESLESLSGVLLDHVKNYDDINPAAKLAFDFVGFNTPTPDSILRTRMWASARTQTLYRTISGFMNYRVALMTLHWAENSRVAAESRMDFQFCKEIHFLAKRKFRFVLSVQKLEDFNAEELEDLETILRIHPSLNICYLETVKNPGKIEYYASLITIDCPLMSNLRREPMYRIKLSGNPILGDGKSDNQNLALIFYRGEYIQLVDANQDNYLEECLKIRSLLAEFEEINYSDIGKNSPVAIVGAREYIFSENIGVLGDVAAGKEQTFGTLFARTLAKIGGKLHYGHPDFLNGIFMTTRGGVSKGQRGLHLNEDIYAGINALLRGGKIKHSDYYQCGKGRDLGFASILNFTTKIGAGMGEQMLSREYHYLGTQLPLDRFLSFYYAHPGFHINNMFIFIALQLFLLFALNLAAISLEADFCEYDGNAPITSKHDPAGCLNIVPVLDWVRRYVLSIVIVFFISFLPLFVQETIERGPVKGIVRLGKHLFSLSPLFEVFVCQIYGHSLLQDLLLGGAKYISTGRGFATSRVPFTTLYRHFASVCIIKGMRSALILLVVSCIIWNSALLWFWATAVALCLAPSIFNPYQFSRSQFIFDYRRTIEWFFSFNQDSWMQFTRENRSKLTGFKRGSAISKATFIRPGLFDALFSESILSLVFVIGTLIPYLHVSAQERSDTSYDNPIARLCFCVIGPIAVNAAFLIGGFVVSLIYSLSKLLIGTRKHELLASPPSLAFPIVLATTIHGLAVIVHISFFHILWLLEGFRWKNAVFGIICSITIQSFLFNTLRAIFLSRELTSNVSTIAWWTGTWTSHGGSNWRYFTQPCREFFCRVMESSLFARDFLVCHILLYAQFPLTLIPYIEKWHTFMLFWIKTGHSHFGNVPKLKNTIRERAQLRGYFALFIVVFLFQFSLSLGPFIIPLRFRQPLHNLIPETPGIPGLVKNIKDKEGK